MDTATCWFGTFVFVLKPAQSIGSTTPTEVTCSFFLCFRQVLFSVSVRWNLSRGSLLHIIHMMVRRERHDIDYRNCQKMLLLLLSKYCLCKTQSKGRYHCRSCGLVLCGNCFKWRHLVSCHDGSMSQQVEGAVFFFVCSRCIHGCTLSDLSNAAAMFLFGYRLSVVISFLLQSLPLRAPRLW